MIIVTFAHVPLKPPPIPAARQGDPPAPPSSLPALVAAKKGADGIADRIARAAFAAEVPVLDSGSVLRHPPLRPVPAGERTK